MVVGKDDGQGMMAGEERASFLLAGEEKSGGLEGNTSELY
jgi:hypothetical protein